MALIKRLIKSDPAAADGISIHGFFGFLEMVKQGRRTAADLTSEFGLAGDDLTDLQWWNTLWDGAANKAEFVRRGKDALLAAEAGAGGLKLEAAIRSELVAAAKDEPGRNPVLYRGKGQDTNTIPLGRAVSTVDRLLVVINKQVWDAADGLVLEDGGATLRFPAVVAATGSVTVWDMGA